MEDVIWTEKKALKLGCAGSLNLAAVVQPLVQNFRRIANFFTLLSLRWGWSDTFWPSVLFQPGRAVTDVLGCLGRVQKLPSRQIPPPVNRETGLTILPIQMIMEV